jgi:Rap1a immunity proteins
MPSKRPYQTILVAILAMVCPANASYFHTANDISEVCSIRDAELVCSAYLAGVMDSIYSNRNTFQGEKICLPEEMTLEQVKGVLARFLEKHPDFGKAIGASVVAASLEDAYPCQPTTP